MISLIPFIMHVEREREWKIRITDNDFEPVYNSRQHRKSIWVIGSMRVDKFDICLRSQRWRVGAWIGCHFTVYVNWIWKLDMNSNTYTADSTLFTYKPVIWSKLLSILNNLIMFMPHYVHNYEALIPSECTESTGRFWHENVHELYAMVTHIHSLHYSAANFVILGFDDILTGNISPTTNTIATHETISAWFWITNSWLKNGGFLLDDFLAIPGLMAIFSLCWSAVRSTLAENK